MALPEKLMEKLVCPQCKGALQYGKNEESLVCNSCKLSYRIVNNIPVLLVDEADKL